MDGATGTKHVLYAAIVANLGILVAKLIATTLTGSSAMLSEAIHSLVDTGNGGLLLLGLRLSNRPSDETHPFGYGKELYFWTMVVALAVFALGGGASIYEGVEHVLHPRTIEHIRVTYAVLGCSAAFEGYSLWVAFREFGKLRGSVPFVKAIQQSKDPASFTVLFEDSTAVLGVLIAFLATVLTQVFRWRLLDGSASILIGLLLMFVAALLGAKTKALLIGEGLDREALHRVREIAQQVPGVIRLGYPFTTFFGPHNALLTMTVQFRPGLSTSEVEKTIDKIEGLIQADYPDVKHIFLEVDTVSKGMLEGTEDPTASPQKGVEAIFDPLSDGLHPHYEAAGSSSN